MQPVLRILPEPIPEVPRDGAQDSAQGVDDGQRGIFGQVYQDQLDQESAGKGPALDEKAASSDTSDATTDVKADSTQVAEDDAAAAAMAQRQSQSAKAAVAEDGEAGDSQALAQSKSKVDQLMALMEGSGTLLKKPQGIAPGEPHPAASETNDAGRAQNKLSSAIEAALKGADGDKPKMSELLQAVAAEQNADSTEQGESVKAESSASAADSQSKTGVTGLKLPQDTIGQLQVKDEGDKKLTLDDMQTAGIASPKGEVKVDGEPKTGGIKPSKLDPSKYQTPGINPHIEEPKAEVNAQSQGQSQGSDLKVLPEDTSTPPIVSPHLDETEIASSFKDTRMVDGTTATEGINPKVTIENSGQGGKTGAEQGPIVMTPLSPPETNSVEGEQVETLQVNPQLNKDKGMDAFKTPDIQGPKSQPEVSSASSASSDSAAVSANARTTGESIVQATASASDVDGQSVKAGENAVRDNKNILGTADKPTISAADAGDQRGDKGEAQKVGDEAELMQADTEQQLAQEQGGKEQQNGDRNTAAAAKDFASALGHKLGQSVSGVNGHSMNHDRLSAIDTAMADKTAAKAQNQLQQPLNINHSDFGDNMKERLVVMMNKGVQSADIRLDPAELGQMKVKMSVENDVTSVNFVVHNAQAKELLEQAMPKLKDMLAQQGIELGEGTVQQEEQPQPQWDANAQADSRQNGGGQFQGRYGSDSGAEPAPDVEPLLARQVKLANGALGGIDFFA